MEHTLGERSDHTLTVPAAVSLPPTLPAVLERLLLVRHGEVFNPDHVVYADLAGFGLSDAGKAQASETAAHLRPIAADLLLASPIRRAIETSLPIAAALGLPITTDDRLYEWRLGTRWAPAPWDDLPTLFPGEVEAYLDHPDDLPFAPESISEVADRFASAVVATGELFPGGTAVMVSHQDPVQAARLRLTGRPMSELAIDKPDHGSVIDLIAADGRWIEASIWHPATRGEGFPPATATQP